MSTEVAGADAGFDLAEGETLVPGSVMTLGPAAAVAAEAPAEAEEATEPVSSASDAAEGDAPPEPTVDGDTNI